MICNNCGTQNGDNSKFCVKCGSKLSEVVINEQPTSIPFQNQSMEMNNGVQNQSMEMNKGVQNQSVQMNNGVQNQSMEMNNGVQNQSMEMNKGVQNQSVQMNNGVQNQSSNGTKSSIDFKLYFLIIWAVISKPFSNMKNELNKISDMKNSIIFTAIISGIAMLISLGTTMYNALESYTFNTTTFSYETTYSIENLKNVDYVAAIFQNFLMYAGAIAVIAGIYFILTKIVKKQSDYFKLLNISTVAVIPALLSFTVLSPLLSLIHYEIGIVAIIIGIAYTLVLIYEGINSEIALEGDNKYYINLAAFSVIFYLIYKVGLNILLASITSGFGDLFSGLF